MFDGKNYALLMLSAVMLCVVGLAAFSGAPWKAIGLGLVGIASVLGMSAAATRLLLPYETHHREWQKLIDSGARDLELISDSARRPELRGTIGRCQARIDPVPKKVGISELSVFLDRPLTERSGLGFMGWTNAYPRGAQRELLTGDRAFDEVVVLTSGGVPEVLAALDADTRARVVQLVDKHRAHGFDGAIRIAISGAERSEQTLGLLDEMAQVCEALFGLSRLDIKSRLLFNALEDPVPAVRAKNLRVALEYYPVDGSERAAVDAAVEDDDLDCALAGAVGLSQLDPQQHEEALFRIKTIAGWESADEDIRNAAIDAMLEHFQPDELAGFFDTLAASDELKPSRLLAALAQSQSIDPATVRGWIERDEISRASCIAELARLEDPRYDALMIELIDPEREGETQKILAALADHGSLASVESLLPFVKSWARRPKLRSEARRAIAAIQSRHGSGEAGLLTVSDDPSGQGALSTTPGRGALSPGEDPEEV